MHNIASNIFIQPQHFTCNYSGKLTAHRGSATEGDPVPAAGGVGGGPAGYVAGAGEE